MGLVLTLLVGLTLISLVVALVMAAVGHWLGARLLEVGLFIGPRLFSFHLGQVPVRISLIPVGSSVRFRDLDAASEEGPAAHWGLTRQDSLFEDLSLGRRLTILLSGWIVVDLLAALILGPAAALQELGEGFNESFVFFATPGFAQQALASFDALVQASPLEAGALWALKITALDLAPFPLLTGGFIVKEIFSSMVRKPVSWPGTLNFVSFALLLGTVSVGGWELWVYLAR